MDMPGRQYNATTGYRYGFNGKEKDTESPVQYDYGFRIYDLRLVRFKSIDPLTAKYPELTPYQFASNSPISGVDLDGLEYIHFHVLLNEDGTFLKKAIAEDFRNKSEAEMNKMHNTTDFYKQYSAGFGPEGKGVKYTYFKMKKGGGGFEHVNTDKEWEVTQNSVGDELSRHGLYYGAGSITTKGPLFESEEGAGKGYYDFGYKPIDIVDDLGRKHDMEEDVPGFKGWQHPQNVIADIRFVKRLELYLENAKKDDFVDYFTGKKPSEEALAAARNAVILFKAEIFRKKLKIDLLFAEKKISGRLHIAISDAIKKAENEQPILFAPNSSDK